MSDDLSQVTLAELRLASPAGVRPSVSVSAARASLRGLPSWGRPPRLPVSSRAALLGTNLGALCLAVAFCVLAAGIRSRMTAGVLSLVGIATALGGLRVIEGTPNLTALAPVLVPVSVGAVFAATGVVRRVLRT